MYSPPVVLGDPMLARRTKRMRGPLSRVRIGGMKKSGMKKKGGMRMRMAAPAAIAVATKFHGARGSRRLKNTEVIADVAGAVAFTATGYYVNPGLATSFPWLSAQAKEYQQYRFHSIRWRYVPRVPSSTVGSVILSVEYNMKDPPPTTELDALNGLSAIEDVCWTEISQNADTAAMYPSGPRKMVRDTRLADDLNLYDSCKLYVCTVGFSGATPVAGKLFVDYDVELFVPQSSFLENPLPSVMSMYRISDAGIAAENAAIYHLLNMSVTVGDGLGLGAAPGTNQIILPRGTFWLHGAINMNANGCAIIGDIQFLTSIYRNSAPLTYSAAVENRASVLGGTLSVATSVDAIVTSAGGDGCGIAWQITSGIASFVSYTITSGYLMITPV